MTFTAAVDTAPGGGEAARVEMKLVLVQPVLRASPDADNLAALLAATAAWESTLRSGALPAAEPPRLELVRERHPPGGA